MKLSSSSARRVVVGAAAAAALTACGTGDGTAGTAAPVSSPNSSVSTPSIPASAQPTRPASGRPSEADDGGNATTTPTVRSTTTRSTTTPAALKDGSYCGDLVVTGVRTASPHASFRVWTDTGRSPHTLSGRSTNLPVDQKVQVLIGPLGPDITSTTVVSGPLQDRLSDVVRKQPSSGTHITVETGKIASITLAGYSQKSGFHGCPRPGN